MELLGDVGHVESRFFPFGDSVGVGEIIYRVTPKFNIYTDLERRYESVIKNESENLATIGLIYNF